jgi:methylmalonyl-CoA mutase N-terminal domain/subunit
VDPLAGSYYVEALTNRIENGARTLIEEVDAIGGAAAAIQRNFYQDAIARSAYRLQQEQESGALTVVGVNRFTDAAQEPILAAPDYSALAERQRERLAAVKRQRDAAAVATARARLRAAAGQPAEPVMPLIIEAVRARATLGEISDTLREAWGVYGR